MPNHEIHRWLAKVRRVLFLNRLSSSVRLVVVSLIGGFLVVVGLVMIVAPGPAMLVIPLGLVVLATEFEWAEGWARKMIDLYRRMRKKLEARERQ